MPYDKIVPLVGVPAVALIENSHFEHDPIGTATLGRVSTAMIRQHNRSQRGQ
ncbi:hypothetical protein [Methanoregula sp.]|jgi:hypothetical protein|uniref:hypothetical protein n=1 Tax=Methanoregula sp. TaxID=2052170 RepID=UPI0025D18010|nr:hypothetical protein [Methanoregula sp.]